MTTWGLRESSRAWATMSAARSTRSRRINRAQTRKTFGLQASKTSLSFPPLLLLVTPPQREGTTTDVWLFPSPTPSGPEGRGGSLTEAAHHHAVLEAERLPQHAELLSDLVRQLPAGEEIAEEGDTGTPGLGGGLPGSLCTWWVSARGRRCRRGPRRAAAARAARRLQSCHCPSWRSPGSRGLGGRDREKWGGGTGGGAGGR